MLVGRVLIVVLLIVGVVMARRPRAVLFAHLFLHLLVVLIAMRGKWAVGVTKTASTVSKIRPTRITACVWLATQGPDAIWNVLIMVLYKMVNATVPQLSNTLQKALKDHFVTFLGALVYSI
jgi:hypothetical protein